MGNFPDTVEKVSIHPTNTGAYEITANARKLKPDDQAQPILTKNQDYILLKDPQ